MLNHKIRNTLISAFVIVWALIFHYESVRYFYLEPLLQKHLPKMKFLFPPAGWIMFYNVDEQFGYAKVYGIKQERPYFIDPHDILLTKAVGYDNIHRNVLSMIMDRSLKNDVCRFLGRKFPGFENFYITAVYYPSFIQKPLEKYEAVIYECTQ